MKEINKRVLSETVIYNVENVQINNGGYGNRRVVVDGKEVNLSKVKSINIYLDGEGIKIDAKLIGGELPYKE